VYSTGNLIYTLEDLRVRSMAQYGLLSIFDDVLSSADVSVRLAATAILASIVDNDATMVRSFSNAQHKQHRIPLISLLIDRFLIENDTGLRHQISDLLISLLDIKCHLVFQVKWSRSTHLDSLEWSIGPLMQKMTNFYQYSMKNMPLGFFFLSPV
jgi:hypothetical protein